MEFYDDGWGKKGEPFGGRFPPPSDLKSMVDRKDSAAVIGRKALVLFNEVLNVGGPIVVSR